MRQFIDLAGNSIVEHIQGRVSYLDLFIDLGATSEEWFRIELLAVLRAVPGIRIMGTNQQTQKSADRPDFTIDMTGRTLLLELKVLPRDRNYPYGWQRFLANSHNRKDFENIVSGIRHGLIYVYWPDLDDWQRCRANIERNFPVHCFRQDQVVCNAGHVVLSYWASAAIAVQPGAHEGMTAMSEKS